MFSISGHFANAIFRASLKQKVLENVKVDVDTLTKMITNDAFFLAFSTNPTTKPSTKMELIKVVSQEKKFHPLFASFLEEVAAKGRLNQLQKIMFDFNQLYNEHNMISTVTLTFAEQPSEEIIGEIKKEVGRLFPSCFKVNYNVVINPDIIGGFVAECNQKIFDMSLSTRIKKINESIKFGVSI